MDFIQTPKIFYRKIEQKTIWFHIVDAFLGAVACYFLLGYPWNFALWNSVLKSINSTENILNWVQSSPAGLKLNDQVSRFLANCFRYQLNLCRSTLLNLWFYTDLNHF